MKKLPMKKPIATPVSGQRGTSTGRLVRPSKPPKQPSNDIVIPQ